MAFHDSEESSKKTEAFVFKVLVWLLVVFVSFEAGLQIGIHRHLEDVRRLERELCSGVAVGYRWAE